MFNSIMKWIKPASKRLPLERLNVIRENSYPCESCNMETAHCFKLHFADRTICVQDKQYKVGKRVRREKKN